MFPEGALAKASNDKLGRISPFAALGLRMDEAKRFRKVANAHRGHLEKNVIGRRETFRKNECARLMKDVYEDMEFVDGIAIEKKPEVAA
jgi:hypothetical protein